MPFDVVVVARLHDLVPLAEHDRAVFFLALFPVGRVERLLQMPVQLERAQLALARGRDDLNVVLGGDAVAFGQPVAAERNDAVARRAAAEVRRKKKSLSFTSSTGSSPALMRCALVMMRLSCACRKIFSSRATPKRPLSIISASTLPAPTGGSWSASPDEDEIGLGLERVEQRGEQ